MQSEELTQPRWNAIANEMLPKFKHIGEYPEACQKLQQINALCEKAGGSLVSRQVIATVLANKGIPAP
jgi:hypothetical protein